MVDLFGNEIVDKPQVQDWSGNAHSVLVTVGASSHSKGERAQHDYYATSPSAAEWLLKIEDIRGPIWEPCVGEGHLAKVFVAHGYDVKSTDLIDRGYGTGGIDFLKTDITEWNGSIITNPPFKTAQEITEKALSIIPVGQKVCMFLRTLFLEGIARRRLFDRCPPKRVWVASRRIVCAKNGDFDATSGGVQSYSWFVWEKGYKGDTTLKWFN